METCALCLEPVPADPCGMDWLPYAYAVGGREIGPICPACAADKTTLGDDGETEVIMERYDWR